jgi:Protein of unknown function (DUF1236)
MTNRFMMSVAAAALIAGSGFAFAQGAGGAGGAGGGAAGGGAGGGGPPTTQQNPAPSGGAMNRDSGGAPGMNTTQSKEGMGKDGTKDRAQSKDGMSKDGTKDRAQSKDGMSKDGTKDSAQSKDGMTKDSTKDSAQSKDGVKKDGGTAAKDGKSTTTTGNAATSATAAPPPEKRTQIVSAIKSETSIKETTNVNFNISVGTRVPSSVTFYPLPPRIVEIYPEWRGYQVILVSGRYVIVRPQTHEIVYIIEG